MGINSRTKKSKSQVLAERKACLKSQIFNWLLKTPSEGARQISGGKLFQNLSKPSVIPVSFWLYKDLYSDMESAIGM